jgi:hypothetical protein
MALRNVRQSSFAGGKGSAGLWRRQYRAANFCGARADGPIVTPRRPFRSTKGDQRDGTHAAGGTNRRATSCAPGLARASPSSCAALDARTAETHASERFANKRSALGGQQPPPEKRGQPGRRCVFSSHCSVRLLEPRCGIPAFVKSQSASLLEAGRAEKRRARETLASAVLRTGKQGDCAGLRDRARQEQK